MYRNINESLYAEALNMLNAAEWQRYARNRQLVEAIKELRAGGRKMFSLKEAKDIVEEWIDRGCIPSQTTKAWVIPCHNNDGGDIVRRVIVNDDGTYTLETVHSARFADIKALTQGIANLYNVL